MGKELNEHFTEWAATKVPGPTPGADFLFTPMWPITEGEIVNPTLITGGDPVHPTVLVTEVTARHVTSSGFTFVTSPAKHFFEGTIDFRITAGPVAGNVTATITALANWAHWYQFFGRDFIKMEENVAWWHLIDRIEEECTH
jgi:uncharacterized protein DUF1990